MSVIGKALVTALMVAVLISLGGCCCAGLPGLGGMFGPGGIDVDVPTDIQPDLEMPEIDEPEVKPDRPPTGLPDIPVYPGASHDQEGDMPFWFRAMTGEYARFDWRVYTTGDPAGRVVDFYENEMPNRGWEGAAMGMGAEMGEAEGGAMLTYSKGENAEGEPEVVALIFVAPEDGETSIIVVRAEQGN